MLSIKMRNKIIAGVLGVSLVGGTVFASTDAGASLQTWYNGRYKTSTTTAWNNAYNYGIGKLGEAYTAFNTNKQAVIGRVGQWATQKVTDTNSAINATKAEYSKQLTDKRTEIANGMEAQYKSFSDAKNTYVNGEATRLESIGESIATTDINGSGTTGVTTVTNGVTPTITSTVSALQSEINAAKADLNRLIAASETATERSIKENIDAQKVAKEQQINALMAQLEETNKGLITTKATELQNQANAQLDALVSGINAISDAQLNFYGGNYINLGFKLTAPIDLSNSTSDIQITYGTIGANGEFVPAKIGSFEYTKTKAWSGYLAIGTTRYCKGTVGAGDYMPNVSNVIPAGQLVETNVNNAAVINAVKDGNVAVRINVTNASGESTVQYVSIR